MQGASKKSDSAPYLLISHALYLYMYVEYSYALPHYVSYIVPYLGAQ